MELLVGDLREGAWSRLLLQGVATRDLRPELPPETPLVEALWGEYWDAVLLDLDSVLLLYCYDQDDVRIIRALYFAPEGDDATRPEAGDGERAEAAVRRLSKVWASEERLESASHLRRQLSWTDRAVERDAAGRLTAAGLEFGRLERAHWALLRLVRQDPPAGVRPGGWEHRRVPHGKFPAGFAYPDWFRSAVLLRGCHRRRELAAVYGADGAGRLWLLAQGEVSSLASLALGTLLRRRVGLAVLADQLPADSDLRHLLLRHHSLPDSPNPKHFHLH